ncbi:MAG: four helix bundle protein [Candidatus Marinimicrobia bacterium]|nr:four helix bundle protein [Candidatus Neomarinimicrobiota bacterium]MCF7850774.1 four helix bundle protein [Candidatus Neomarinimicrobiota bacterium]MCF7904272.1 four helix bundle protein [Candidatus Neomarinimicrobiota bacterium]
MATLKKFEDVHAWQKTRVMVKEIYTLSSLSAFSKDYGLKDQIRRCGVSIMANIAEGYGRKSRKEFAYFLNIAHGSAAELQSHLYIALDLGYIDKDSFDHLYAETEEISKMILGLQNYLRKLVRS